MSRFDRLAQEWDLKPARVASAKNLSQKIVELVDLKDLDVLDYGAGTGLVSFNLCEVARTVIGMDNSQGMLDEIDKKARLAQISNVHTRYHDMDKETLPSGCCDLFISSMTMHHIKDTRHFLTQAKRSLRAGGIIAINDLEKEDGSFHSMGNDDVAHFGFDPKEVAQIVEDLGMKVIFLETIEVIKKEQEYPIFLMVAQDV